MRFKEIMTPERKLLAREFVVFMAVSGLVAYQDKYLSKEKLGNIDIKMHNIGSKVKQTIIYGLRKGIN